MSNFSVYKFISEENDIRLDVFISNVYENASRTYLQKLIKNGNILVNENVVFKPSYKINEDDEITLNLPQPMPLEIIPEDIPLDIIYEDDDILIINKPKGMVVHPANGHYSGTLVNAIMYHCKDSLSGINGIMRPGIVHRIDMDTSGSLIICKNDISHTNIAEQLRVHSITRIYKGIVTGRLKDNSGTVKMYIGRDSKDRKKMAPTDYVHGKEAITHYKVIEDFKDYQLVEFKLETGRTHQIRVAMKSLGHPLLGDVLYGNDKNKFGVSGQMLHAQTIGFIHPTTNEYVEFSAPFNDEFEKILKILRNN